MPAIDFIPDAEDSTKIDFQADSDSIDFVPDVREEQPPSLRPAIGPPGSNPQVENRYVSPFDIGQVPPTQERVAEARQADIATKQAEAPTEPAVIEPLRDFETPKLASSDLQTLGIPKLPADIAAGAQQAVAGAIDFFMSPEGATTLGTGAAGAALLNAVFKTEMAASLPGIGKRIGEKLAAGDTEGASQEIGSGIMNALFIAHGVKLPESKTSTAPAVEQAAIETLKIKDQPAEVVAPTIRPGVLIANLEANNAPLTAEAVKPIVERSTDASQIEKASEVHADVPAQPVEFKEEVPVEESSQGVQRVQGEEVKEAPVERITEMDDAPGGPWFTVTEETPSMVEGKPWTKGTNVSAGELTRAGYKVPEQENISVGPGAASPIDRPGTPPQAIAAGAEIENAPPSERPFGNQHPISSVFPRIIQDVSTFLKGARGDSMPKTTAANREVGEAGVRFAASRIAARPLAQTFAASALEGTGVDPIKFGAALTEDNLVSIREGFRQEASRLLADGKPEESAKATEAADSVATIIGAKGSPFKTQDDLFDFLNEPGTKQAIAQHVQLWKEIIDPQFREAQSLDPDVELPSRGQNTGARINLKAVLEGDNPANPIKGLGGASLTATFKRKSPFAIKAKGTGQSYDINYSEIVANTFERQLERANKNVFDKSLVDAGLAVIDRPGKQVVIGGEPGVPFPLVRKSIIIPGEGAFSKSENLYVRRDLASEYRVASNVDQKLNIPILTSVNNVVNKIQLAGLTDFSVHLSNQMTALFDRPVTGKLFSDSLLSATGRADVPLVLWKAFKKARDNNQKQLAELAEIGALRPEHTGWGSGKFLGKTDQITRLLLDDTFKSLTEEGLVENTETARREYVNQIGQYNRRLQGPLTRFLRDTGMGPFVTAGKTFNALGVRMATLSPGAEASSLPAAVALRMNVLSKWIGLAVLTGTLNYLLTKDKGGGITGRPGTPLGNVDFGKDDKSGKQTSLPLSQILGLGRGLRVTGLRGLIESKRLGLPTGTALDAAARDLINSWASPAFGPPLRTAFVSASGYQPAIGVGRASRVAAPGESQIKENVKEALLEANPVVDSVRKAIEGKPMAEVIAGQIPRFTLVPGKKESLVKDYPRIVSMAQANAFIEDVIYQARRLPDEEKKAFIIEQVARLDVSQRERAMREILRRKVMLKNK